jgi:hypothetical protein
MKKLLLLAASVISLQASAQLPSLSFEGAWNNSTLGSAPDPTGWASSNILTSFLISASNPTTTSQSTLACNLVASMRIESKKMQTVGALAGSIPDTCGFAFSGAVVGTSIKDGFAYTARPTQMTFCYNAAPVSGDTAGVGVRLWKSQGGTRIPVGSGVLKYAANSPAGMTNQTITIAYTSTLTPDSAVILVGSSYKFPSVGLVLRKGAKIGSVITVDNFNFVVPSVGLNEKSIGDLALNVYPNPASTAVYFSTTDENATKMVVYDVTGKVILSQAFENGKSVLNVADYNNGLYLYKVFTKSGEVAKAGKFTVAH